MRFFLRSYISYRNNYKNILDRCLWMRRANQWNGHAIEKMFWGGLNFKNGQNSKMSCMPVPPNKN